MGRLKKEIEVAACFLVQDGKVLIARRRAEDSYGLLWEFPGGEVEKGETRRQALRREMQEELNIEVKAGRLLGIFSDENEEIKIKVYLYRCLLKRGKAEAKECAEFKFAAKEELPEINFAPLDKKISESIKSGRIVL